MRRNSNHHLGKRLLDLALVLPALILLTPVMLLIAGAVRTLMGPPVLFAQLRPGFESNYVAPLGPMVDAFELEFAEKVGIPHAAAVVSGTAAMHLENGFKD